MMQNVKTLYSMGLLLMRIIHLDVLALEAP